MDFLWDKITEWLKEMLVSGVISNLTGLFDATNQVPAGECGVKDQVRRADSVILQTGI